MYSLDKEEARGDTDNLGLVIEHTQRCIRDEAITAAVREVRDRCARFQQLARQVPAVCSQLGLTGPEQAAVDTYIHLMGPWMSGYHAWETQTRRYTTATHVLPSTGPGYFNGVLRAQPPSSTRHERAHVGSLLRQTGHPLGVRTAGLPGRPGRWAQAISSRLLAAEGEADGQGEGLRGAA
ncbi:hypothetical protein [Streptomyces phaeoluteigriseus]|uniref:hypothetical protein n=1 Tax=Streptomyces phaeoluteigriseus TaxID=114686 RepID=UPI0036A41749